MKKCRRIFSGLIAMVIAVSGFNLEIFFNKEYKTAMAYSVVDNYPNADVYVAECIINGLISPQTGVASTTFPAKYNDIKNRNYYYEQFAKTVAEQHEISLSFNDKWDLAFNTMWDKCPFNLTNISDRKKIVYEAMILEYLEYEEGSTVTRDSFSDRALDFSCKSVKVALDILPSILDKKFYISGEPIKLDDISKEFIENFDNINPKEQYNKFNKLIKENDRDAKKILMDIMKKFKDNPAIPADLASDLYNYGCDETVTAKEYYATLKNVLMLDEIKTERIYFLEKMKIQGKDNKEFVMACNDIIKKYNMVYSETKLDDLKMVGTELGVKYLTSVSDFAWNFCKDILGTTIDTARDMLDVLFNINDISANNIRLILQFKMGQYAKDVLINSYFEYTRNRTEENALQFVNAYKSYLAYQSYSSEWAKDYVKAYDKGLTSLLCGKNINDWLSLLNGETNYLDKAIDLVESFGTIYTKYVDIYVIYIEPNGDDSNSSDNNSNSSSFPGEEDSSYNVPIEATADHKIYTYNSNGEKETGHYISLGDKCTIYAVYKSGFVKVRYPSTSEASGKRTAFARLSDFSIKFLIFPGDKDNSYNVPIKVTANKKIHTYDSNGNEEPNRYISSGDVCTIYTVYKNGFVYLEYPSKVEASGKRPAFAKLSDFNLGSSVCRCSTAYAGTYTTENVSSSLIIHSSDSHSLSGSKVGSIPAGAVFEVTRADGSLAHVNYNGTIGIVSMNYIKKSGSRPEYCNCSESYSGTYTTQNVSSSLNIRSESTHSLSGSIVGKIPAGASFEVTKADGYIAHVNYNGTKGVVSMSYIAHPEFIPEGYLDTVEVIGDHEIKVTGWAMDRDNTNASIGVHIYIDGPAGTGTCICDNIYANEVRTDVNNNLNVSGNHGFSAVIKLDESITGEHLICAHGINIGSGNHNTQLNNSFSVNFGGNNDMSNVNPIIHVDWVETNYGTIKMQGWCYDKNCVDASLALHVYLDYKFVGEAICSIEDDDGLKGIIGPASSYRHRFFATFTTPERGNHQLEIAALDVNRINATWSLHDVNITAPIDLGDEFDAEIVTLSNGKRIIANGDNVVLCSADKCVDNEKIWHFERQSDDSYVITSYSNSNCLDVEGGINDDSINIQTYPINLSDAQRWNIVPNGDGYYLRPANSATRVLDIASGIMDDYNNIQLYTNNTSDSQRFKINKVSIESCVTFDANGGTTNTDEQTVEYNSTYGILPIPTRTGYIFEGWYTDKVGGIEILDNTKVGTIEDQTLYAQWREIETISDEETTTTTSVEYTSTETTEKIETTVIETTIPDETTVYETEITTSSETTITTEEPIETTISSETETISASEESTETTVSEKVMYGDVNNDGKITLRDVMLIKKYIVGGWGVTINENIADVNHDKKVTLRDVMLIKKYIVGGWGIELN